MSSIFFWLVYVYTLKLWRAQSALVPQLSHKHPNSGSPVPEIIDPVFAKTSPKRSFSMTEYERFGLVFTKTRVYKFGTCSNFNQLILIHAHIDNLVSFQRRQVKNMDKRNATFL